MTIAGTVQTHPLDKSRTALLALCVVAVSFLFRHAIAVMLQGWGQEEYSHGFLIPLIALALIANTMEDAAIAPHSSWAGFALVLVCIFLNFFLEAAGIRGILPQVYLTALIGVFMLFWGVKASWTLAGPLAFLFFAAPLPKFFYYTLSFNMQMLATTLGTKLLDALAIPVFQDGNIIDLGGYKLEVAEACNGLRYLFPLMGLSFLLSYMYKASILRRALLFVSAIPIAVLMNGLRIAAIGITVNRWGIAMAEGVLHDVEGWMIFLGCAACLLVEIELFQRIGRRATFDYECLRMPKFSRITLPGPCRPAYFCLAVVLAALGANLFLPGILPVAHKPVALKASFASFPLELGGWIGHFAPLDSASLAKLGTHDYLLADYTRPDSPPVNLYALYYPEQDSISNEAVHVPVVCIPAGGWRVESTAVRTIRLNGGSLTVNRIIVSKELMRQVVYYWFLQDGKAVWESNSAKLDQVRNAITKGRTDGAMIRLMTVISAGESESDADSRLTGFMRSSLDTLDRFMFPTLP